MLLRSSRKAIALTKESGVAGAALKLFGKGVGKTLKGVGRTVVKHPAKALATTAGVGGGAAYAIPRIQKGQRGMNPQYMQARRWGHAPPVTSRAGSAWRQ